MTQVSFLVLQLNCDNSYAEGEGRNLPEGVQVEGGQHLVLSTATRTLCYGRLEALLGIYSLELSRAGKLCSGESINKIPK